MAFPYTFEEIIAACRMPGVKAVERDYGGGVNAEGGVKLCPLCCLIAAQHSIEEAVVVVEMAIYPGGDHRICASLGITGIQEAGFIQGVDGGLRYLSGSEYGEAYDLGVRVRKELWGK